MVKHESNYNYVRHSKIKQLSDRVVPILVFFATLTLYVITMAPSLLWGNSAVLALNSSNLGINQSPTYPLFTLIGKLFSMISVFTPAFSANLMSAVFGAIAVMFFYLIVQYFLNIPAISASAYKENFKKRKMLAENPEFRDQHKEELDLSPKWHENLFPNLMATGLFAVTLPVWLSAVRADVYSLQLALTLGAIFLVFKGARDETGQKYFYAGLWLYLLSFGNHPLIAATLFPAFIFMIFYNGFNAENKWGVILTPILLLVLALSSYLFIPFRSAVDSSLAYNQALRGNSFWGGLIYIWQSLNFADLATGTEYWVRLKSLVSLYNSQIGLPLLLFWFAGIWGIFIVLRKKALFFILAIIGSILFTVWLGKVEFYNYDQINFQSINLALILTVAVVGVIYLMRLKSLARGTSVIYSILIAAFLFLAADKNSRQAVLSDFYGPDIICDEILDGLGKSDIVIIADEEIYYPLLYKSKSDYYGRNIKVVYSEQLTNSQYRRWLVHNYSDLKYDSHFSSEEKSETNNLVQQICALNKDSFNIFVQSSVVGINSDRIEPAGLLFRYLSVDQKPHQDWSNYQTHLDLMDKILLKGSGELTTINFISKWVFDLCDYHDNF
ncbi:MAG: DUF2723 domain-containing protein, partial [Candidatus Zixiibacteriota bacterium]